MVPCLLFLVGCSPGPEKKADSQKTDELTYIQELQKSVVSQFREYERDCGRDEARLKTVQWAKGQKSVKDSGLAADGETIWILLESGIELNVLTDEEK